MPQYVDRLAFPRGTQVRMDYEDHIECYKDGTDYVVLVSPYNPGETPASWSELPPMYSLSAKTFACRVSQKTRLLRPFGPLG